MINVLVLGATGNIGRRLIHHLTQRNASVRRATRTPVRPGDIRFDWADPASWSDALDGVERIFLMTPETVGNLAEPAATFIDVADDAGVAHVVLLSAVGVDDLAGDPTGMAHIETAVRGASASHSILRANTFMENFTIGPFASAIIERNAVVAPVGDARVSFVGVDDIARVADHELNDTPHGETLTITGPDALSFADCADEISNACDRAIDFVDPGVRGMRQILEDTDAPPPMVDLVLGFYATLADGSHAAVTTTVADLTGAPPATFADFCAANAAAWSQR